TGTNWTPVSKGIVYPYIYALAIRNSNLFAGTSYYGIWRRPLSEFSAVQQKALLNNIIVPHPNYPNPFSTQTTISFTTDKTEFVNIKIFDLLGKECTQLYSG